MDLDVLVDIRKGTQTWGSYWCRRPPGRDLNPTPPETWILCMAKLTQACLRFYFWTRIKMLNSNSRYQLMHVVSLRRYSVPGRGGAQHNCSWLVASDPRTLLPDCCVQCQIRWEVHRPGRARAPPVWSFRHTRGGLQSRSPRGCLHGEQPATLQTASNHR
jgi:hypothetical protein